MAAPSAAVAGAAAAIVTATLMLQHHRRRSAAKRSNKPATSSAATSKSPVEASLGSLSSRGAKGLPAPSDPYFRAMWQGWTNAEAWGSDSDGHNPKRGYCMCGTAENRCTFDLMQRRMEQAVRRPLKQGYAWYFDTSGMAAFKDAFAAMLVDSGVVRPLPPPLPARSLPREGLFMCAGVTGALRLLITSLTEAGTDAAIVPAPHYGSFDKDLGIHSLIEVVHPQLAEQSRGERGYRITEAVLEEGRDMALAKGLRPRVVVLTNPNNPLGMNHSPGEVRLAMRWCRRRRIHLVSDEIYANSVWDADGAARVGRHFASVVDAARDEAEAAAADTGGAVGADGAAHSGGGSGGGGGGAESATLTPEAAPCCLGNYVHALWGLSKDFGVSGFRVGALYTENAALRASVAARMTPSMVSGLSQMHLTEVLNDTAWVSEYLAANHAAMRRGCSIVSAALTAAGARVLPAHSGIFVWVDLRPFLAEGAGYDDELALLLHIADEARVVVTPGRGQHAREPGWCRVCTVWMPHERLREGMERMAAVLRRVKAAMDAPGGER